MDLDTVRVCFKKYVSYLEEKEKVKLGDPICEQVTIEEMDKLTQTLFMDYVMKNSEKINQTAIACVLYKHVNTLIRQYIQETPKEKGKEMVVKIEPSKKKKGWFW